MINYVRNSDPNYYVEKYEEANCGSYALNLQGWYDPEGYFCSWYDCEYVDDGLLELLQCGYSEDEVNEIYAEVLVDGIMSEFEGEIRLVDRYDLIDDDEELIAFRTFALFEGDEFINSDFHFRVYRDGTWMEKQGWHPVEECEEEEWGMYDSQIYYFAHKKIVA